MEKQPTKTEAELIATVADIPDAEGCLRFAQRAMKKGMPALAAACEERAKILKPLRVKSVKMPTSRAKTGNGADEDACRRGTGTPIVD
jgi:hypothetical protein